MKGIFAGEGRLTEEANQACKINGIDPSELIAKTLDSFKRENISLDAAHKLHNASKKKRQGLLALI
jgi:hypothetical protein